MKGIVLENRFPLMSLTILLYLFSLVFANGTYIFYLCTALMLMCSVLSIKPQIRTSRYLFFSFIFILYNVFHILFGASTYLGTSLSRLIVVILNFIISTILYIFLCDTDNRNRVEKYFTLFAFVLIVYCAVYNNAGIFSGRLGDESPYLLGLEGVNGLCMNSNGVGRILYSAIFLLFMNRITNCKPLLTKCTLVTISLFILAIVLTGSRTTLLTAIGYIYLYSFIKGENIKNKINSIAICFLLLAVTVIAVFTNEYLYNIIGSRIEIIFYGVSSAPVFDGSGDGNSLYYRLMMIEQGLDAFFMKPLIGWGLFAYSEMDTVGTYTHNNFVELLVSCGIIGFIIYYWSLITIVIDAINVFKCKCYRNVAASIIAFWVITLIMNMTDVDYLDRVALFIFTYMTSVLTDIKSNIYHEK